MFACIVTAQRDVIHLANIHQFFTTRVADGALNILLHLDHGVGQLPLDRLKNALALSLRLRPSGFNVF